MVGIDWSLAGGRCLLDMYVGGWLVNGAMSFRRGVDSTVTASGLEHALVTVAVNRMKVDAELFVWSLSVKVIIMDCWGFDRV